MSRTNIENIYPLSPMQQGMLFDTLYASSSGVYFVQVAWTLRGGLDAPAFLRAWQEVVDRHAILRTGFAWERLERPMQIVRKKATLPVHEQDLRALPNEEQARVIDAYAAEDRARGFELSRAPLMRVALFRLSDDTYRFLWGRHHLLLDGWSNPLLVKEVFALYQAFSKGEDARLPRPRPYGDYIGWLGKQDPAKVETFWRARLEGFPAPTPLGIDRAASGEARHEDRKLTLTEELSNRLQTFARQHHLTLSTLVQGAWALLLSRYSGESDVLFGATVSGRSAPVADIDKMIGMFINTLPVRVQLGSGESALAWLTGLHKQQLELRDYEHSALVELQGYTRVPRGTPLFESLVVYENYPVEEALRQGSGGLSVGDSRTVEKSNVPLTLLAIFRRALTLQVSYDARRFDVAPIERMLGHLATLLEGLIAEPARLLADVPMLTEAERHRLVVEWNETAGGPARAATLHGLFEAQVDRTPDATALVDKHLRLTYRELESRANRLANHLRRRGVGVETLVALCADRSAELVVALLAILKAGGAYVPLDPAYPAQRIAQVLDDANVPLLVTQARVRDKLPARTAPTVLLDDDAALIAAESDARPTGGAAPTNLGYVIYTSGSTGRPKGVAIEHHSTATMVLWAKEVYPPREIEGVLFATSICFDLSLFELFLPLCSGTKLILAENALELPALPAKDEVTLVNTVPTAIAELCRTGGVPASVRTVCLAGEPLTAVLTAQVYAIPTVERVYNLYGPTEDTTYSTFTLCKRDGSAPTIGRPLAHGQAYIVDARFSPVPIGVAGEIYLGGEGVARGYLGRPDLTAERFIQSPFVPGARLYKTGDLGRFREDGEMEYLGRADFQVKVRGFRIELGEIEAVLLAHPGVREVVVTVREDTPGDKRVVAYLVPGVTRADAVELRAHVREKLPEFMVPAAFVQLDALPLTPNGKVDRKALPAPEGGAPRERAYVAPRGPVEEAIASIFAEVLKLSPGEVGAHDGFFELGGHSLLATQAISRFRGALGADLPLRALFEAPTPAELAVLIAEAHGAPRATAIPPLVHVARGGHAPLSFGQERLWFLAQLDPLDTSYNIPFAVRMEGALDVDALRRAVNEIVRRHEVLRTTFTSVDGKPAGVVHDVVEIPLTVTDLTAVPVEGRDAAIREATGAEARTPFDLSAGPVLRTRLLALGPEDHVLVMTLHHIVADVWTRAVLNRELSALYEAFRRGEPSPLPELAIQYADYAAWQRSWLSGEALEAQLAYWKNQLAGAPRVIELPTDRPRPAVRSSRGERRNVSLSPALTSALRDLARREGVTLYMLLLAALDVLLYRYTGQSDIVVGSPIAGRTRAETEGLIGFFLNTLVLRTELSDELTFKDLLQRVKAVSLGAFAHQDMPFERLVQELDHERDLSRSPLFQVIFNLQNVPREAMALSGVGMKGVQVEGTTTKYDLTLILAEGPRSVGGSLAYSTDLFDAATIERLLVHFQALLEGVVKGADKRLRELPMLPDGERDQLLVGWNETRVEHPAEETIVDLFEAQVDRTPDAVALVAGDARLSFRELDARANRLAHHLRKRGVGPDVVVGLCLDRSAELIVGLLGILKAGGAYVPLEPTYPAHRLAQILGEARAPVLVTLASLTGALPGDGVALVRLDADADALAAESDARPEGDVGAGNLAYVLFTSGSTGKPKGVAIEHRQLVNYVRGVSARLELPPGASYAHVSTFSADLGNTVLYPPLCLGGTLHVLATELVTDPAGLAAYFVREGIDCLKIVPSHLAALLSAPQPAQVLPRRLLVLGGEATSWELVDRLERLAPDCRIMNHYGPTETTVGVLTYPLQKGNRPTSPILPLGRPLPNSRVYVLDPAMAPAPMGVPGEVYIGGAGVARGYLHQPELTAERFVQDPFSSAPGARLYRTGDRARYLPDGSLVFLGRIDFQVKIRGYRIELGEIEAALVSYPSFNEAVVLADEDPSGDKRLVAYVVPVDPAPDLAAARAYLAQRLPEYMVPATFVVLTALPLTPNGKIDRRALPALSPALAEEDDYVAPRNPIEEVLASIWTDVFEREHLGVHERFADLGGHSLLAIQIIARARDAFQIELPLRAIFEHPTIAGLAEQVEREMREGEGLVVPPIARAPRDGFLPVSFAQERLWFLNQLEPDSAFYNVPLNMRFAGALDVPALERALREVIDRHEVLRTTFTSVGGKAAQRIHPVVELRLAVEDLSALPEGGREDAMRRASTLEVQRPFDLATGPLIRARLVRLSAEDHALLMTSHHIVSDGWTRGILNREVMALYHAFSRGEPSPLAPLPIQYADYAAWQRRWLDGAVYDKQMGYWKEKLGGAPPELLLPTDRPRPPVQTYRGAWRALALPAGLATSLKELSRAEGVTFFMTLLAAFDVLLHRLTGQDDLVLGTPVAGRTKAETEGLIGFFINTLVLRTTLEDGLTFRDLLQRVRETCLGAYAHQDMSFERLVQELAPERDLSRAPLFQVLFTFQNPPREPKGEAGLRVGSVRAENPTSKYDITLALSEQNRGLVAAVEYSTDLFDQSTIERMLVQYRTVLQGIVANPEAPIVEIPVMLPEEERRILVDWNRTAAEYPGDRGVHQLIEEQAARTPDAVAVAFGDQRLTYRELDARSNQLAHYLGKLGVGPDVLVGLCLTRSLELAIAVLGVLKAGGAYVPIDPSYPMERVAWMLEDSAVPVVLTQEKIADELPAAAMMVRLDADWYAIEAESAESPGVAVAPENLAYIIYTSGSTGKPKGVMIHHRGLVNYLWWAKSAYAVSSGRGAPVHSSVSFDLTVTGLFTPLLAGRTVVMLPEEGEIEALVRALTEEGDFSLVKLTPAHLEVLNQLVPADKAARATGAFVIGGEALSWETLAFWRKHAPRTRLINEYGPTETVVGCCVYDAAREGDFTGPVPIGRPIANTELYVLDRRLRPVPIGVRGELYIGGAGVARGYLNRPELTAERFIESPFAAGSGARLYKTGDVARWRENAELEFLGRFDDQVKIRGYRIELGEIESVLAQHPGLAETVILAREDTPGDRRLVAYYVAGEEPAPEQADLRSFLASRLPEYMVPTAYVRLDAMPLTPNGKVDRKSLPAPEARGLAGQLVLPRNPVEEVVAGAWAEVLDLPQVGVHDNFFDLGGHSLLATQVMGRIATSLSVELPLQSIFEAPTVAGLAERVSEALARGHGLVAPPLVRVARDGELPLSFGQERLWFLEQLAPGGTLYVIPQAVRLSGPLDAGALERALQEIVRRHEVLRTTFAAVEGKPRQIIHPSLDLVVPVLDLEPLAPEEREAAVRREARLEAATPFDLAAGPLLRPRLLRLSADEHVLLLTMHHVVSDAWSQGVLNGELVALYDAFLAGRPSPLGDLAIQYADYAAWQRSFLSGEVLERELAHWREALAGAPRALELPTDRPRPPVQSPRGGRKAIVLPSELRLGLKALSRREGATLFMTLLAAFEIVLHRYTGQDDLVVGTPIAGRARAETEGLVGFFVNALALRTRVSGDLSFQALLARVKDTCLQAYAHQEMPFERLVHELAPERDLSRQPLFQVTFTLNNAPREALALPGLSLRGVGSDVGTAKYDLSLAMMEGESELFASFSYAVDLFDAATVDRMLGHLRNVLEAVVADPAAAIGDLPMLSAEERRTLTVAWNDTAAPFPADRCAHELFEEQAARAPDALAIVFEDRRLTYREVDERANQLARHLTRYGVGPEVLVGVSLPRSPEVVVAILGVMKAGGAYVPLDPAYPADRLEFMMADARVAVLLTEEALLEGLPPPPAPVICVDTGWIDVEQESADGLGRVAGPGSAAYVIYTSGSTGRPKGVVVEHRGLGNLAAAQARTFGVDPSSRVLQFASSNFDASVSEILVTLLAGATLVLAPQEALLPGPELLRTLTDHAVTVATIPPSALAVLPHEALPLLRTVVVAGEACSEDLVARWAPGRSFINAYGPTEASVCATMGACAPSGGKPSIGKPMSNVRVYVLDARRNPVPVGVPGELYIGGIGLARGYLNRPELTSERFVAGALPEEPGGRLYRTGDLCRFRPDGDIDFIGRIDHQVKVRGFRIELGEIEAALAEQPGVRDAAVLAREDVPGDTRLVAYVVLEAGAGVSVVELKQRLRDRLPDYMVPATIVELAAMPLSPNGKVDRKALPAPDAGAGAGEEREQGEARGPIVDALATIFADVLRRDAVGVRDGFFELGGHSLLATQVIARVREAFGVEVPLRALFEAPSPAALAVLVQSLLREGQGVAAPPLVRAERSVSGALPLSFGQERLWFLDQLEPGDASYIIPLAVRMEGALDAGALRRALVEVVRRHEALRTTFTVIQGKPSQQIHEVAELDLPTTSLIELPAGEREAALRRDLAAEAARPFDLAAGPIFRARLFALAPDDHVLLLTMHHIASDGWSMGVLNREIAVLYQAFRAGEPSPLPDLPVQYADYAAWQRGWLSGDVLEAQLGYWRGALAGAPAALELPTDRPRPPVQTYRGARRVLTLPADLTAALKDLSRKEGATLFMTLLAAFDVLLQRHTGQTDVTVGTPIAGRTHAETEPLVGVFINTLVLRAEMDGDPTFRELLQRVKRTCLGAYAHQDMPFERLVQELSPERDLSRSPLFQVMFTLQNAPRGALGLGELRLRGVSTEGVSARFDLSLSVSEGSSGLGCSFVYNVDLFDAATIDRLAEHFLLLLRGVVATPSEPIARLAILTPEELRSFEAWNQTAVPSAADTLLHELVEAQAARTPAAVAVTFEGRSLTYGELDARANQLGNHLRRLGVGPDVLVGVCLERSLELPVALLGVLKAGGAYVPIDPSYPEDRIAYVLDDARAPVLLTSSQLLASLPRTGAAVVAMDADPALAAESAARPASHAAAEHLAYVIYTSGSTGRPKGVMIPHRAIVNHMRWMAAVFPLGPSEAVLQKTPISFDASVWEVYLPLMGGARLVMARPGGHRETSYLVQAIVDHEITELQLVPSLLELLVLEPNLERCTSLKRLFAGGEALSRSLVERFKARLPIDVVNLYGPTECAVQTVVWVAEPEARGRMEPIGRPIHNVQAHILDAALRRVPLGVAGELCIGGRSVGRGYLNRPDLTAERFVRDPFSDAPEALLYRTGDRCRFLPDGVIEYLGRLDFQVKLRGFRVELGEIEVVLAQHAGVREAAVVVREDTPGDQRLVAYVVAEGPAPGAGELRAHVKGRLPEYMVPAAFVVLPHLPLTPNGKLDRKALPAPDAAAGDDRAHVEPRGPVEEGIAAIFAEVLRAARVGARDGFFDLGGHSLLATQAISRIRDAFRVELPLRAIFEAPTPAALALLVEEALRGGHGIDTPRLTRVPRGGRHDLSFAQERLWFLAQLEPDDPSYVVPLSIRLGGAVSVPALSRALAELVRRHEVLRTTFALDGARPAAVIHDDVAVPLVVTRWDAPSPDALRAATAAALAAPFDLATGPLLRAQLFELDAREHLLFLTLHHIVCDAWTLGILRRELAALYEAFSQDRASPLADLPVQYVDYAAWQRGWLSGDVLTRELSYWKDQLQGAPAALDLPTDSPRPPVMSHRGELRTFTLPEALSTGLAELARREGVTLFMLLLAAFETLLHRYAGQGDLLVGTPIAGRSRAETEGLVGVFLNTLVLRTAVDGELTFRQLLGRVREVCLGAYAHQDLPFERLVQEIAPERDLSRSPLFQVMFTLHNAARASEPRGSQAGLAPRAPEVESGPAKFDLSLALGEGPGGLRGSFEYATDLFDRATIARMVGHLEVLLTGVTAAPDTRLRDLAILTEDERRTLTVTWNDTRADYPAVGIPALVAAQAERAPDAAAVSFEGASLTYRELVAASHRVAHRLRALGVGPGVLVGVAVERSIAMVSALLGILQAGGAYVPLDPTYPRDRLAFMAEDARLSVLVTEEKLGDVVPGYHGPRLRLDADAADLARESAAPLDLVVDPASLAYVIYTSGSTGKPKGVEIPHRAVVSFLGAMAKTPGLGAHDRLLAVTSLSFDIAGLELWLPLSVGAHVEIASRETAADGRALATRIREGGITTIQATPSTYRLLLEAGWEGDPGLRVLIGGEAVPRELAEELCGRARSVWNMYGPTETTIWSAVHRLEKGAPVLIGRPIDNTRVRILDAHRALVPVGVPGELYIGGDGLARGYLDRPALTAERFVADPFGEGRLYRTGDLCRYRPDGALEFLGRIDFQVKIRGFRVELGEIEAILAAHPAVREAVVTAREDVPGDTRLVAYVTPAGAAPPAAAELRAHLREKLPEYMVPSAFVVLEKLPLTANNKIDRKALPAPDAVAAEPRAYEEPTGPVAQAIAAIFAEVLRAPRVGARDGFFELGGHSLLATAVIARVRAAFGVELPLRALFEAPTPSELGARVDAALRDGGAVALPPLTRVARTGDVTLSFGQERLWFIQQLDPGDPSYVVPLGMRLAGPLDLDALTRALAEIARRHEVLRTTYALENGQPVARVHEGWGVDLVVTRWPALSREEREATVRAEITAEVRRPFDFAVSAPIRAQLFVLDDEDHVLLVSLHHIVSDAWSTGVLGREIVALYGAFREGQPSPLAELPIQYADFAAWQRGWLVGEALERQLAYWKQHLAGAPAALDLPTDRPRPRVASHRGGRRMIALSPQLSRALAELARREGATLFMTLLAAFDVLLRRWSGQRSVVVGTPIAGRTRPEMEPLIGFFVNTLAIHTELDDAESFTGLLARVKEACLGAYAHQELPFERLVQAVDPARDLGRSPIFQAMFALQNTPGEARPPAGLARRGVSVDGGTSKFDLTLTLVEGPGGLVGPLEYAAELFDATTIDRMAGHLTHLLEGIVAAPGAPISALPLLGDDERRTVLVTWNDTAFAYPEDAAIHQVFEAQVDRTPDAVAVSFEDDALTYRQLDEQANRLAHALRARGVGPDVLVGVCLDRSLAMLVALHGVLKAGGAYVPLDPEYPRDRLAFMLADCKPAVILTQADLVHVLPEHDAALIVLDRSLGAIASESSQRLPRGDLTLDHLAYVIYTSGSTGRPKGAMNAHRGVLNRLQWMQRAYALTAADRVLQKTPFSFDVSVWELFWPLMFGARLVVARPGGHREPRYLLDVIASSGITMMHFVPSMLGAFLDEIEGGGAPARARCGSLRRVACSGEALPAAYVDRFHALFADTELDNLYGPTEAAVDVTAWTCRAGAAVVPIGRPIDNTRIYLLDEHAQPVPIGVRGELYIGGVQVGRGYLNRPELTAERFLRDPFDAGPGARMYRTGDVARWLPDGEIEYVGRADFQVKLRGFRIELGEIESVLTQHPGVAAATVVLREDTPGNQRLVAYVVVAGPEAPGVPELRASLHARLPEHMVPAAFVLMDALPLTASGKIDRRALPRPDAGLDDEELTSPRTPTEEAIAAIWGDVLGLARVGVHQDFFALGGHSLLATKMMARLAQSLHVELPLRTLFEAKTVAGLAEVADFVASARPVAAVEGADVEEGEL
jgi:amino acid adenylation domain-containing protein